MNSRDTRPLHAWQAQWKFFWDCGWPVTRKTGARFPTVWDSDSLLKPIAIHPRVIFERSAGGKTGGTQSKDPVATGTIGQSRNVGMRVLGRPFDEFLGKPRGSSTARSPRNRRRSAQNDSRR